MNFDLTNRVAHFFTPDRIAELASALFILFASLVASRFGGRWVRRFVSAHNDAERAVLAGRLTTWGLVLLGFGMALDELGFQLRILLGAAGVLSVAIGFASQTTLSNLISGIFLFGERPFAVGDIIEIDTVSGEVLSIDMMATTLRTMDNRFVRIPNELIIKTKVTNQSRYLIRRLELTVAMALDADFARIRGALLDAAQRHPLCLADPAPAVFISGFGELSMTVTLWLWTRTKNLQDLRAAMTAEVQGELQKLRWVPGSVNNSANK